MFKVNSGKTRNTPSEIKRRIVLEVKQDLIDIRQVTLRQVEMPPLQGSCPLNLLPLNLLPQHARAPSAVPAQVQAHDLPQLDLQIENWENLTPLVSWHWLGKYRLTRDRSICFCSLKPSG